MKTETLNDKYKPVPLNLKKAMARAMRRPGFKAAWNALETEYTALDALLDARKQGPVKVRPALNMTKKS